MPQAQCWKISTVLLAGPTFPFLQVWILYLQNGEKSEVGFGFQRNTQKPEATKHRHVCLGPVGHDRFHGCHLAHPTFWLAQWPAIWWREEKEMILSQQSVSYPVQPLLPCILQGILPKWLTETLQRLVPKSSAAWGGLLLSSPFQKQEHTRIFF